MREGDLTITDPTEPQPDVLIVLKAGGKLQNVKITTRKTNISSDVLVTVNKDSKVKWLLQ